MTTFKGHKTAFNRTGSNEAVPNEFGEPATKFTGRGALPAGQMKHGAGKVADISGSNRHVAKAKHGAGSGGTPQRGTNAFTKGGKR